MKYKKCQLTEWIPGHQKPVRIGVYERKNWYPMQYSFWTGVRWVLGGESPLDAMKQEGFESSAQDIPWRGLNFDPSKKGKRK